MTPAKHDEPKPPATAKSWGVGAAVLAALIVAAVGYWAVIVPMFPPPNAHKPEIHSGVGEALPYLELRPLTGDSPAMSLSDLENHVTLLNFWGTWCQRCRDELPHIAELRQRYAGQETFRLLAVSCPAGGQADDVQSLQEDTASLLKRFGLDMPTYFDPDSGTQYALGKLIVFEGYPTTVLLDRRAVIRAVWVGYRPGQETEMERYISMVLEEGGK